MDIYSTISKESAKHNEDRDCAVKAVAILTGLPYSKVHKVFAQCGRTPRKATPKYITFMVLGRLGVHVESVDKRHWGGKTVRTLGRHLTGGGYLIAIRNHLLAIVDGQVCDWTRGRLHQVKEVHRVYA